MASALFLFSLTIALEMPASGKEKNLAKLSLGKCILIGVVVLSITESFIAIFQWLKIVPSKNELFTCTGTWVNPNVTAIFLALGLFSFGKLSRYYNNRTFLTWTLFPVLVALFFLHCRTAYVIASIAMYEHFVFALPKGKPLIAKISVSLLFILILAFACKNSSTSGRVQIWKNSVELFLHHPAIGVGLGQFEKEYNAGVARFGLPSRDHVNMAYNDFLELAVEGGLVAVAFWMTFLILAIRKFKNDSASLSIIISFIIVQLTNFGFQAFPVFALFLIYMAYPPFKQKSETCFTRPVLSLPIVASPFFATCLFIGFFLFIRLVSIANAFHQTSLIHSQDLGEQDLEEYRRFSTTLDFSSNYHESYGDLYMQRKNYRVALWEYQSALKTASRPNILGKCGWCYGQLHQYDSAAYYFGIIEKLQPYKYAPRFALLKLYEQKKDTTSIKIKAKEIIAMPIKVPSTELNSIKAEAAKWLQAKL
jgi:hypothetical protein